MAYCVLSAPVAWTSSNSAVPAPLLVTGARPMAVNKHDDVLE